MSIRVVVRIESRLEEIRAVRDMIYGLVVQLGMPEEAAHSVRVALGEALANAWDHGYGGRTGPLEIHGELSRTRIHLVVRDEGPTSAVPVIPKALTFGQGMGLYLISKLMDEVRVEPNPDGPGVSLRMSKVV